MTVNDMPAFNTRASIGAEVGPFHAGKTFLFPLFPKIRVAGSIAKSSWPISDPNSYMEPSGGLNSEL